MDHLQSCAKAFEHLLDFQYHIIIGRKGKSVELNILFDPTEIEPFIQIENFLDSNKLIFRYNQKLQTFSLIEVEYLLSTPYENTDIYIFLDRQKEPGHFFCRSPASDTFNKVPSHSLSPGSTCNAFCTVVNTLLSITPPCFLL